MRLVSRHAMVLTTLAATQVRTTSLWAERPTQALAATPPQQQLLRARIDAKTLLAPSSLTAANNDAPLLPSSLVGRYTAEQTLRAFSTPLGVQFIGAAGRPLAEAEASAAQTRAQMGAPIRFELRFVAAGSGAVEDRSFNAVSRYNAFAGRQVVSGAEQCDAGSALSCTQLAFRGPVRAKTLVNAMRVEALEDGFIYSEYVRSVFARLQVQGDTRDFRPIVTDAETIVELARDESSGELRGRLRLASFLQPLDPLYFEAQRRAVSISDYDLRLIPL